MGVQATTTNISRKSLIVDLDFGEPPSTQRSVSRIFAKIKDYKGFEK